MPASNFSSFSRESIESITLMAYVAEAAEWDNRPHLRRIKSFTYLTFISLAVPAAEAELLALACVLHDVGKASTPDELLRRQGSYTPSEWAKMERHTTDGAKMLHDSVSPILRTGATVAFTHHERWDGSGYPRHLSAETIPLCGRVCAVADVFDALTTQRIYKDPIDPAEAFDLIRASSGKLFDPSVVKAFLDLRSTFLSIQ